ncbi:MAG: hypothetical protein CM15mP36_01260 [Flavobacteriales bacterium]|nr:MAG: hypothetical protein CM15mP36_01260 [Flavobacteriales bacterium]
MSFKKNVQKISADNVAAIIRGSEFPDEYVVLTAHLDHVGTQMEIYTMVLMTMAQELLQCLK